MNTGDDPGTGLEVAIVGMAGRFPGAPGVDELWRNVVAGQESISSFDQAQLAAAGVPAAEARHPDYVPAYGTLPGVELFDARFFGYSARDASLIDPQQRLFLQCAWEALEASGHLVAGPGELVGVYAGTNISTYLLRHLIGNPALGSVSEHELLLANDKDSLATRVTYHLDLRGPAVTVQTGCSSSLVAVHLASQALLACECDVAIAGGANIRLPMHSGYRYETGGVMSRDGHCRAFDAQATGTVGGNGVGAVVLRRLADALRDGDTIYAVIKASAINNDGGVKVGYTAPSVDGQAAVIHTAQHIAEVDPDTIGYVETHGTGTKLGDEIEFQALAQAFRQGSDRLGFCALGSVKALIGHLDAAAGVAGLIKASLALHHGVIPPSPYFTGPPAGLDLAASPFYLNTEPLAWPRLGPARRAAVSSFGMGGTNAHVVLEQAPEPDAQVSSRTDHLLVLSARTGEALARMRNRLGAYLREHTDVPLADVAYTVQATRRRFTHRLALVSRDATEAAALLTGALLTGDSAVGSTDGGAGGGPGGGAGGGPGVRMAAAETAGLDVAFLFPGQGAQHVGMAAGLYDSEPAFAEALDECAERLSGHLGLDLREVLYPGQDTQAAALLGQTRLAQPALFAVEYALARLWERWGVRPAAMLGHSVGEYAAACLAGVFTLDDALAAVATRCRLMQAQPGGAMLSVQLPAAEVEALLAAGEVGAPLAVGEVGAPLAVGEVGALLAAADSHVDVMPEGVSLAADNAPGLSVVAGPAAGIEAFAASLAARGISCRPLHTSHAFHSAAMAPVVEQFAEYLRHVELRPPRLPMLANLTGDWLRADEATDPRYWARQLREPVRFGSCARRLLAAHSLVLEVGPGTTLATLVRQQDAAAATTIVGSLSHPGRRRPDGATVAEALGRLWLAGADLDPHAGWAHERRRRLPLPAYPFEPARHWVDPPTAALSTGRSDSAASTTAGPDGLVGAVTNPALAGAATLDTATLDAATLDTVTPGTVTVGSAVGEAVLPGAGSAVGPAVGSAVGQLGPAAPDVPEVIRRIWVDLLGAPDLGQHDDFFELGGHSLLGTKVIARIRDALGVDLPAAAIFEAPTIAALAAAVERLQAQRVDAPGPPDGDLLPDLLAEIRAMSPEQLREQLDHDLDPAGGPRS